MSCDVSWNNNINILTVIIVYHIIQNITTGEPQVTSNPTQYISRTGSSVILQCTATGNPGVSGIYWQRYVNGQYNNVDIDGAKYSGASVLTPSLTITSTAGSDSGTYRCVAQNSIGPGFGTSVSLTVTGGKCVM